MDLRKYKSTYTLYLASIAIKGFDGLWEIVGGILLFILKPVNIHGVIKFITLHELSEDKNDIVANYLLSASEKLSLSAQHFGAWYLLWHGIIKIFLVINLLKKKYWAYPTAIAFFTVFIFYQIYRYTFTHSVNLIILTVFDCLVIWLVLIEYRRKNKFDPEKRTDK